jgi:anti-sigma B factor antagonist
MELKTTVDGNKVTIEIEGKLSVATSPDLEAAVQGQSADITDFDMDLTKLEYISSAGLRVLLATFKQMKVAKGGMELTNVGENFKDVLQNTGLDAVFGVF